MSPMYSDEAARDVAAAVRDQAAAHRELAAAVRELTARLPVPTAGLDAQALMDLALRQRLKERPATYENTHAGRVQKRFDDALAMQYVDGS